jgi:uncharacterized membrane protein YraQ (UPF0718 family)
MITLFFYLLAAVLVLWSFARDPEKARRSLKRGCSSLEKILPLFLSILVGLGMILAFITPETIAWLMGTESGIHGLLLAAGIGSCTVIPGFVTFPLARTLLQSGAGTLQVILFISCSVMVGILTLPIEVQYFGHKAAYIRNGLSLLFSFLIAFTMEVLLA